MKLRLLLIGFLMLPFCRSYAWEDPRVTQQTTTRKKTDSLLTVLKNTTSVDQFDLITSLANAYTISGNGDSAIYWAAQARDLARRQGNAERETRAFQLLGNIEEVNFRKYKAALSYYTVAAGLAKNNNLTGLIDEIYTNILNLNFYLGDFVNAMRTASDGLRRAETSGNRSRVAHYQSLIGFIHLRQKNPDAAQKYYYQYLQYAVSTGDSIKIADAYTSLGECDITAAKYNNALQHIQASLDIYWQLYAKGKLPKADRIPYTLFRMGYCYGEQGQFKKARPYVLNAIRYTRHFSCNLYDIAQYKIYAGNLFHKTHEYPAALRNLRDGLYLAKAIDHKENIRDAFYYLQELFVSRRLFDSAYYYNLLYNSLKDSIANEKTTREIEQIGAAYALEKKDNQIKLLEQQKKLQEARSKRQLLWRNLIIIIGISLMTVLLLILNRRYLRRKNKLQEEINMRQHEIFNISATVQDHERKRIAQDLHDGMGTLLSAARMKLSSLSKPDVPVRDSMVLLDDAITELRNISHNLMPATLSRLGLVAALQNLFDKIHTPADVQISLVVHGFNERMPEEKEMIIYRVILELVNNVVKHANATVLTVQLVKYPDELLVTVEDNGNGMTELSPGVSGIGLNNIRSRIAYLDGSFRIDSNPGSGTTIIIEIPD